jgi:colanic acid/amylovoran biosynthesis protein
MRILIINTVVLNGGDAAILQAIMDLLRMQFGADTTFVVHESQPKVAAPFYPELTLRTRAYRVVSRVDRPMGRQETLVTNLRLARFRFACELRARGFGALSSLLLGPAERRLMTDFAEADLVVTSGGTYLVEHYDFTSRLFAIETALRLRRPLVFFTQSLGPFTRPETRRSVARAVNGATLVLLRDELSLDHLREIGVREDHLHVTADAAFALADEAAICAARTRGCFPPMRSDDVHPRVAVSVRAWSHFEHMSTADGMAAYRAAMCAAVTLLVERYGARVTFISTCQGTPGYWTDDSRTASEIAEMLPPQVRSAVDVDSRFHQPAELAAILPGFDLVVSTRLHMAILALDVGTMVFPVAYEFKTRELFNRLGLGEYVHDMEGVNAKSFAGTLDNFLRNAASVRERMFAGVEVERRRAIDSGALVAAALDRSEHRLGTAQ